MKSFSKIMYHLLILKKENNKLIIEAQKAFLIKITGLFTFNEGGQTICFIQYLSR